MFSSENHMGNYFPKWYNISMNKKEEESSTDQSEKALFQTLHTGDTCIIAFVPSVWQYGRVLFMYEGQEFQTTCNEEAVIKAIGKITQEFSEFEDLTKQIELRRVLDEVLYGYEVRTKVTALVASDIEEKVRIFFASKKLEGMSNKTIKNYSYILSNFAAFMKKPITSITAMDMRMYLSYVSKNVKSSTVNCLIYCFKIFHKLLLILA
jgi:hypothetical protein